MLEDAQDRKSQKKPIIANVFGQKNPSKAVEIAMGIAWRKLPEVTADAGKLPPAMQESQSVEVKASQMRRTIRENEGINIKDLCRAKAFTRAEYNRYRDHLILTGGTKLFAQKKTGRGTRLFSCQEAMDTWERNR